jgi:hypothetical protein
VLHHYPDPGIDCHFTGSRRWWQAMTAPELRVVICHDEIEVLMFRRSWFPGGLMELLSHQHYPLPGDVQDVLPTEAVWQTLRDVLAPFAGQHLHVVIVLSNQYTRWLVLPWQPDIRSRAEREAYCRHALQQAFGADMQDWQVQSQVAGYGQHTLVNALPPGLTEQLHALFAEYRLIPGMIAPAWMLSVNQAMYTMRQKKLPLDGWVICRESASLTIACLLKGDWQMIRYVPVDWDWQQTLHEVLLREQVVRPELAALPVFMPQAKFSSMSKDVFAPFTLQDVQPSQWLGEVFHQQLRRRLA